MQDDCACFETAAWAALLSMTRGMDLPEFLVAESATFEKADERLTLLQREDSLDGVDVMRPGIRCGILDVEAAHASHLPSA